MLEADEARYPVRDARRWRDAARERHVPVNGSCGILLVAFPGAGPAMAWCHAPADQRAAPASAPG